MILCACKTTEAWMINRWNVWRYLVQHLASEFVFFSQIVSHKM